MPVEMVTLAPVPVEDTAEFVGVLKSRQSTTIQPQAEGFLTAIPVKSGDRVAPGKVMFDIDSASARSALASLESTEVAREADAAYARQQAEREKTLLDVGAVSQQEYDQAATQQKTAEAQLRAAQEQVRQQQTTLGYFRVVAPTAGVVGDIPVRVGDRVTPATVLTTLDNNTGLEAYISVSVQQAAKLKLGLPVRLLNEEGEPIATERITFISPSVDDATQTILVKAAVDAAAGSFRADQFVRTRIVFDTAPGLTVPLVSTLRVNGQYFVFVAESSDHGLIARQKPVSLGAVVGNAYVVRSGLKAGDRLITSGIQKIGDGSPVAEAPPASSAPAAPGAGRS
jgi:RND family efflux transporter MFP subunit